MKEKLVIKNFGPIKSVELELGRFNILIGEQATGKSTVAKILAVCRYFSYVVGTDPLVLEGESEIYRGLLEWGVDEFINVDSFIFYDCRHYSLTAEFKRITFEEKNKDINGPEKEVIVLTSKLTPKSKEFENLLTELKRVLPTQFEDLKENPSWVMPTSFFQNEVARVMDNPFYLPAERGLQSIFSLGKSSIQNFSDSLFNQFARIDQVARLFKKDTLIEPLRIVYRNKDGQGYIRKVNENEFFSLYSGASGYQSTIPIVLLIKYYNDIKKKNKTFLIEEPELNLFPATQDDLMQYFVDQIMNYGNSILLTTHSPYVLTSINNLMYAWQVGKANAKEVESVISKKYWLNPEEVSAYRLLSDGTAKNILEDDLKQINAGELDEISRKINTVWDKIADIEHGVDHEN